MISSDAVVLQGLFEPVWKAIRAVKPVGPILAWGMRLTPVFPEPWPDPIGVVVFAYASALAMNMSDAVYVSRPFAMAHLRSGSDPVVEPLSTVLEKLAVQGIRPLRGDEKDLVRAGAATEEEVARSPRVLSERVLAYYRFWLDVSGAIAGNLPESQQRFFAAVRSAATKAR